MSNVVCVFFFFDSSGRYLRESLLSVSLARDRL